MNRAEMILELWKNPNKIFKDERDNIFFVEDSRIYMEELEFGHKSIITLGVVNYDMDYTEVIRPLWETIKDGERYYFPRVDLEELYDFAQYWEGHFIHKHRKEEHLMFRTEEEAIEVSKRILEFLK